MSNKVTETAPIRIWLQVSDDIEDCDEPFTDECSWCSDSVTACEVEYVRADIHELMVTAVKKLIADMSVRAKIRGDIDDDGTVILDCGSSTLYAIDAALAATPAGGKP